VPKRAARAQDLKADDRISVVELTQPKDEHNLTKNLKVKGDAYWKGKMD